MTAFGRTLLRRSSCACVCLVVGVLCRVPSLGRPLEFGCRPVSDRYCLDVDLLEYGHPRVDLLFGAVFDLVGPGMQSSLCVS